MSEVKELVFPQQIYCMPCNKYLTVNSAEEFDDFAYGRIHKHPTRADIEKEHYEEGYAKGFAAGFEAGRKAASP